MKTSPGFQPWRRERLVGRGCCQPAPAPGTHTRKRRWRHLSPWCLMGERCSCCAPENKRNSQRQVPLESGSLPVCVWPLNLEKEKEFDESCGPQLLCRYSLCLCVPWAAHDTGRTSSVPWCKPTDRGTDTRAALGPWWLRGPLCSAGTFLKVTLEPAPFLSRRRGRCWRRLSGMLLAPRPLAAQSRSRSRRGRFFTARTQPVSPPRLKGRGSCSPPIPST